MLSNAENKYSVILNDVAERFVKELDSLKIYGYDNNRVLYHCYNYIGRFEGALAAVSEDYAEIVNDRNMQISLNQLKKDSRGRVVGGGFGLSGALKGMVMAGTLNMTTGLFASIGHGISNASTNSRYNKQLSILKNKSETKNSLGVAIFWDIRNMIYALSDILKKELGQCYVNPFTEELDDSAVTTLRKLKQNQIPDIEKKKVLVNTIKIQPYEDDLYIYAFNQFGPDGENLKNAMEWYNSPININLMIEKIKQQSIQQHLLDSVFKEKILQVNNILQYNRYKDIIQNNIGKPLNVLIQKLYEKFEDDFKKKSIVYVFGMNDKEVKYSELSIKCCNFNSNTDEVPVLFFYNTLFSFFDSFDSGILFTNKGIYGSNGTHISYQEIDEMKTYESNSKNINIRIFPVSNFVGDETYTIRDVAEFFYIIFHLTDIYKRENFQLSISFDDLCKTIDQALSNSKKLSKKIINLINSENFEKEKKRIQLAVQTYIPPDSEVYLIYDNSENETGRHGFALLKHGIAICNERLFTKKKYFVNYCDIKQIVIKDFDLLINDIKIDVMWIPKEDRIQLKKIVDTMYQYLLCK